VTQSIILNTLNTTSREAQATAAHTANTYLRQTFGDAYSATNALRTADHWQFLIHYTAPERQQAIVAGRLEVNVTTGQVLPLSSDDIQEMQERVAVHLAKEQGRLAVNQEGYVLPYLAKIRVNGYLTDHITPFASAIGRPQWIEEDPPCWRIAVALRLRGRDTGGILGSVDVNALTGEVVPLLTPQIELMQKRAHNAALRAKRSPATAS
jgi:hypothetical protein